MKIRTVLISFAAIALVPAFAALGGMNSGLAKGANLPAFDPTHVTGPDAGTNTCPVCKYGPTPAVQVWVNGDSFANVAAIANDLESKLVAANTGGRPKLKAFVVFVSKTNDSSLPGKLQKIATQNNLKQVSLVWLTSDNEAVKNYAINLDSKIKNTVFVYRNRTVQSKFINLDAKGIGDLNTAVASILK